MSALLAAAVLAATTPQIDPERLIQALAKVEQGRWGHPGGICNMSYAAWRDRTKLAYRLSSNSNYALPVYRLHIAHLIRWLPEYQLRPTVTNVALGWLLGLDGLVRAVRDRRVPDYGARVANLYNEE